MKLDEEFWSERYRSGTTGWDLNNVSPPLKEYFDQLEDKNLKILIPGCGYAHEAKYLHFLGFKNVYVLDLAKEPLNTLLETTPTFNPDHCIQQDIFTFNGSFELIIEQTMFCAIDPKYRELYAQKMSNLLSDGGKYVGLLFNKHFEGGPPFGGSKEEYELLFKPYFKELNLEKCINSIEPRMGSELFIQFRK
jgi:hypothetical protein